MALSGSKKVAKKSPRYVIDEYGFMRPEAVGKVMEALNDRSADKGLTTAKTTLMKKLNAIAAKDLVDTKCNMIGKGAVRIMVLVLQQRKSSDSSTTGLR